MSFKIVYEFQNLQPVVFADVLIPPQSFECKFPATGEIVDIETFLHFGLDDRDDTT